MYCPSPYNGKHYFKNVVYNTKDMNDQTEAYSQNFSYDIRYYNQYYPQENEETYGILQNEADSDKTEITVGDYFQNNIYIDIYDFSVRKIIEKKVKHYVCDKNKDIVFFINNDSGVKIFQDFYVTKSHSMIFNCGKINDYTSKIAYSNKGLQFFENNDYFLSGLVLKKGTPTKVFDHKMYIDPETLISELDGKITADDSKYLVMTIKLSGIKKTSTISINKTRLAITFDGKQTKFDGKIVKTDKDIYLPLESFAKLLGCKTKNYTNEKSLCLTYKYQ